MNGMIQLLLNDGSQENLREAMGNEEYRLPHSTLGNSQECHHVTLAFKPSDEEMEKWIERHGVFGKGCLSVQTLRADDEIAAVFGDLTIGLDSYGEHHVTVAGTVPPKESKRLTEAHTLRSYTTGWLDLGGDIAFVRFGEERDWFERLDAATLIAHEVRPFLSTDADRRQFAVKVAAHDKADDERINRLYQKAKVNLWYEIRAHRHIDADEEFFSDEPYLEAEEEVISICGNREQAMQVVRSHPFASWIVPGLRDR